MRVAAISRFWCRVFLAVGLAFGQVGCADPSSDAWWADGRQYMVAADHHAASEAGAEILAAGGNAVDAAVAAAFALAVVRPESCGLGGGGFMIVHRRDGPPVAIDFRESAPQGAELRHYLDDQNHPIRGKTRYGEWAVAVPGQVKGLLFALERYGSGKLSRTQIIAPAVRLARSPLSVDGHLHLSMTGFADRLDAVPQFKSRFDELARVFLRDGRPIECGGTVDVSEIAGTLEKIAAEGNDGFYQGAVAERIIAEISRRGGPLTHDDLQSYRVREFEPLSAEIGGFQFLTMPPPSSGGAVTIQVLNVLAGATANGPIASDFAEPDFSHRLVEAMKHAFADRANLLGDRDPDVLANVERMISPERARTIRNQIDPDGTRPSKSYGLTTMNDDAGTSHLSVVDAFGGAAACTSTINLRFGSYILVPGAGFVLNNEMDDFAVDTTTPNAFGLRQSKHTLIQPGRRPVSSMSPTIVLKNGKPELVAGASGGPRIISSTLQTILYALWANMPVNEAVATPRMHHQWLPDVVFVQQGLSADIMNYLLARGHSLRRFPASAGHVQVIARTPFGWRGACDPDKGGRPAGR